MVHDLPMNNHSKKLNEENEKEKNYKHQSNDVNFKDIFSLLCIQLLLFFSILLNRISDCLICFNIETCNLWQTYVLYCTGNFVKKILKKVTHTAKWKLRILYAHREKTNPTTYILVSVFKKWSECWCFFILLMIFNN